MLFVGCVVLVIANLYKSGCFSCHR